MREKINQTLEELRVDKIIDNYREHKYYYYDEQYNRIYFYDYYIDLNNMGRKVRIREASEEGYYNIDIYLTFEIYPVVNFGGKDLRAYGNEEISSGEWFIYKEQVKLEDISNEIKDIKNTLKTGYN